MLAAPELPADDAPDGVTLTFLRNRVSYEFPLSREGALALYAYLGFVLGFEDQARVEVIEPAVAPGGAPVIRVETIAEPPRLAEAAASLTAVDRPFFGPGRAADLVSAPRLDLQDIVAVQGSVDIDDQPVRLDPAGDHRTAAGRAASRARGDGRVSADLKTASIVELATEAKNRGYTIELRSEESVFRTDDRKRWINFDEAKACLMRRDYRGMLWELEKVLPGDFAGLTDIVLALAR